MNNIRQVQALNKRELENAVPPEASWHADYRDTAYIYIGGLPFDLSEGDIVTIFSQYGEPVHVNLVRDKETGKSRGFAFLKYEDQRSTDLAVDNLGGATVLGRILRVDHTRYKKRDEEEDTNNVAKLMGETAVQEVDGDTDNERRRRKRRGSEDREPRPLRLLKEEIELQELIQNHDEEDPMKEFLIEEKREEVARAVEKEARREKSSRRREIGRERPSRHFHHHRRHRRDDERSRSRDRSSRDYKERDRRDRSYRDRTPERSRSPSRRERDRRDHRRLR
ncbi:uncharacterized protein BDV17DRAFT_177965 [Aspergillus undulatus]|uniref:uncharacterized protein n=1 Tax=Aspergillus undulatus TaxID=1810928 RepID=UPI003CCD72BD